MSLVTILLILLVIGVVLYIINKYIPMDENIKSLFNIVVIIFVVIWILKATGVLSILTGIHL